MKFLSWTSLKERIKFKQCANNQNKTFGYINFIKKCTEN